MDDEIVEWYSGLRKSPWNNLYSEYLLPYLVVNEVNRLSTYSLKYSFVFGIHQAIQSLKSLSMVTAISEGILAFSMPTHWWHSVKAAT